MTPARPLPLPPGPPSLATVVALVTHDFLSLLTRVQRTYGDVARLRVGGESTYVLSHPDDVAHVLLNTQKTFAMEASRADRLVFGNGLLVSQGEFWRRQRKLAAPAFHHAHIQAYGALMVASVEQMLDTWRDGDERDIHAAMRRLTQTIVAKALFDADTGDDDGAQVARALDALMGAWASEVVGPGQFIPSAVPTPGRRRLHTAVARIESVLRRIIAARRASGDDRGDLLGLLLAARDDDGAGMTDRQLVDELVTLYLAGHETTANTLSWAWLLLARHPLAEAALHAELDATLEGRPPRPEDLPRLPYTAAVIKETLRYYPTVWAVQRRALVATAIGGYHVPAGTTLLMSQWVVHHYARWFAHPTRFLPERWLNDRAQTLPKYAYFPFGGGPRVCIGNSFATMEATLLLAAIARRFALAAPSGARIDHEASITLRPAGRIDARLSARAQRRQGATHGPH